MHANSPPDTPDLNARVTPMMAQYVEIRAANPDCLLFYRMGDFYELFFEDAEVAAQALGIALTKRGKHQGQDVRMCGVPVDRADDYLQRLIALGFRVAVCEQLEDPAEARKRGAKSVVRRDVIRLVTPGTLTEERLLDPARANGLLVMARTREAKAAWSYGLALADISTGAFTLVQVSGAGLGAEIARMEPREIVAPESLCADPALSPLFADARLAGAAVTPTGREGEAGIAGERRIMDYFGVATLEGFGAFTKAELGAAAGLIAYLERTQMAARPPLSLPVRLVRGQHLEIDAATRANLELTRTLSGLREGSLLAHIDLCVTPSGSRLLAERLASPLTDIGLINQRLEMVTALMVNPALRTDMRTLLKGTPDMLRALSRLAMQRGGPRDLAALRDGLAGGRAMASLLTNAWPMPEEMAQALQSLSQADPALEQSLRAALGDDLPLNRRDGGFIRPGFDAGLDETRALRDESRRVIAALQARYGEETDARQLKIRHNHFLGYYIEVPQAQGEKLLRPPHDAIFIHRQTMAGAMRFSTVELAGLDAKIAAAGTQALDQELAHFDQLAAALVQADAAIRAMASGLAMLDVAASLAELAQQRDWCRPVVDNSLVFQLRSARHPVVEAALKAKGEPFVANDCDLSGEEPQGGRIGVMTGPNMAGKSTFLRQNALVVLLAQMGSYVPAASAHIGVVDRLFSRVGAADDLARGRSTFMVEMVETAAILNQASVRSLVILDEIGRGTATYDGLSIAWATIEHLHNVNCARTLFATHFHELTQLASTLPRLKNLTMRVTEWKDTLVFLHEVVAGAADRSYGIQVARLAGLPRAVLARAQKLLAELEAGERDSPARRGGADLPLFAHAAPVAPILDDELGQALDTIDPDALTPREALEALYRLKDLRQG